MKKTILFLAVLFLMCSCSEAQHPFGNFFMWQSANTDTVTSRTYLDVITVTISGNVGFDSHTWNLSSEVGVCYSSTNTSPTISDSHQSASGWTPGTAGYFTVTVLAANLTNCTTYYATAYSITSGTGVVKYSTPHSFYSYCP